MPPKQVYDQINQESGEVFEAPSDARELIDTQLVYRQKTKTKSAGNEDDQYELFLRLSDKIKILLKHWQVSVRAITYF